MDFIINNVALLSLIFSSINIAITIYSWYYSRTNIVFYPVDNISSFYTISTPSNHNYYNSTCIAFVYIKVANLSDKPCTISYFTMSVDGYKSTDSSKRVEIRKKYQLSPDWGIKGRMCVQLPLTLPPLGYEEGYIVFPYAPLYNETSLHCTVTARTARKTFTIYQSMQKFNPDNI